MDRGPYVVAETEERRREWERLMGVDRLPILDPVPAPSGPEGELAYTLAPGRLHWMARYRLHSYLRRKVGEEEAARLLAPAGPSVPIPADGVRVQVAAPAVTAGSGAGRRTGSESLHPGR